MKLSDFQIGDEFKYIDMEVVNRVTDIGSRVLVYIRLDQEDPRNYNGPPFSIVEHVADEYDLEGIGLIKKKGEEEWKEAEHEDLDLSQFTLVPAGSLDVDVVRHTSNKE